MCSFYVPAVGTCHLPRSGGCRNDLITGPFCWRFFCGNEARMGEIQKWCRAFTAWNLFSQTSLLEIFWDDWFTWWSFCPCIPLRERRERGHRAAAPKTDKFLRHRRCAGCHLASDSHPIENQLRMEPQLECFFHCNVPIDSHAHVLYSAVSCFEITHMYQWPGHHVFEGCLLVACRPWLKNGVNTPRRPIRTYPSLFTPILFSDFYHHMISTAIRSDQCRFFSNILPYYDPLIWHMFFLSSVRLKGLF